MTKKIFSFRRDEGLVDLTPSRPVPTPVIPPTPLVDTTDQPAAEYDPEYWEGEWRYSPSVFARTPAPKLTQDEEVYEGIRDYLAGLDNPTPSYTGYQGYL